MAKSVVQVCQACLNSPELLKGCNLFVIAVAKEFGYGDIIRGNADAIRSLYLSAVTTKPPLIYLGKEPALATQMANEGHLVIGALNRNEMTYKDKSGILRVASMGHVVIIAPGGPSKPRVVTLLDGRQQPTRGGYPFCYQGAAYAPYRLKERTQVDLVFPAVLLKEVVYAYLKVPKK